MARMTLDRTVEPCLDPDEDGLCSHFYPVSRAGSITVIQHGGDIEHQMSFTAGEYPEGLCPEGHDLMLEQWVFDVMRIAGCLVTA